MKLVHQLVIILIWGFLLWAFYTYGGTGCSKPLPCHRQVAAPCALKILVQQKTETCQGAQEGPIPEIPPTPPSKSQKRRERRKLAKLKIKLTEDDETEWDFCPEKMIQ